MAINQKAICDRPSVAAKPTHTVPKTKTTCVSTRSKRRSSFLSEALRCSTSRSMTDRLEGAEFIVRQLGARRMIVHDAPAGFGFSEQQSKGAVRLVARAF